VTTTIERPAAAATAAARPREFAASRRTVAILLLIIPLSQIGLDVYTPALPQMAAEFSASNDFVQNTVTVYLLGMSVAFLPVGLIADALGRRRVLLAGLGLLVAMSIGCALAPNLTVLLGMRFAQGIGASACLLLAATIAADCFRGAKLVSVLGLCGAAWGAAPVLAPAVGGFVVQFGSWRLVFALFATLAASVAVLVAKALPETLREDLRSPVDLRAAMRVLRGALRHRVFMGFVLMFGLIGAAQMTFGVVGPYSLRVKARFLPCRLRFDRAGGRYGELDRRIDLRRTGATPHHPAVGFECVGGVLCRGPDIGGFRRSRRRERMDDHHRRRTGAARMRSARPSEQRPRAGRVHPEHRSDRRPGQHLLLPGRHHRDGLGGLLAGGIPGPSRLARRRGRCAVRCIAANDSAVGRHPDRLDDAIRSTADHHGQCEV
jgi:hypothetical protein